MTEVATLVEQWLLDGSGQCISQAISEVELRTMAAFAKISVAASFSQENRQDCRSVNNYCGLAWQALLVVGQNGVIAGLDGPLYVSGAAFANL